jgi:hypothetical protein
MNLDLSHFIATIFVGIGATLLMDVWAIVLKLVFKVSAPNYCLVGRWLCYMPTGVFYHPSIAAAAQKSFECAVGWVTHYLIGVIYAVGLVLLVSPRWLQVPTLLPAMIVGLATLVFPLLVMQPAFGLGIAASKVPNPAQARLRSVVNHAVFGFGLYLTALLIRLILRGSV